MIQKTLFKKSSAHEVELIIGHAHYCRFQLDPSSAVKHMRQRNGTHFLWHPVRRETVQQGIGIRALNKDLGERGYIHDANIVAHRFHLSRDHVIDWRTVE